MSKEINVIKDYDKGEVRLYVSSQSKKDILSFVTQLLKKLNEEEDI